jgi:hypothetical protein
LLRVLEKSVAVTWLVAAKLPAARKLAMQLGDVAKLVDRNVDRERRCARGVIDEMS